jgi:hypothetical protein
MDMGEEQWMGGGEQLGVKGSPIPQGGNQEETVFISRPDFSL